MALCVWISLQYYTDAWWCHLTQFLYNCIIWLYPSNLLKIYNSLFCRGIIHRYIISLDPPIIYRDIYNKGSLFKRNSMRFSLFGNRKLIWDIQNKTVTESPYKINHCILTRWKILNYFMKNSYFDTIVHYFNVWKKQWL